MIGLSSHLLNKFFNCQRAVLIKHKENSLKILSGLNFNNNLQVQLFKNSAVQGFYY